jgi:hypothetical protein
MLDLVLLYRFFSVQLPMAKQAEFVARRLQDVRVD